MGFMGVDIGSAALDRIQRSPQFASVTSALTCIVGDEPGWRRRPAETPTTRIIATRWSGTNPSPQELRAETAADCHVVGMALRPMDIRLAVSGQLIQDGIAAPGTVHVSEPASLAQCLFRGPYDALHLHIPNDLLTECAQPGASIRLHSTPQLLRDPLALQLGLDLLKADDFAPSLGGIYADGISLAIVSRLLALQTHRPEAQARPAVAPMAKWRLRRALDYIEAHLSEPVSLADLAASTGLSRMHFAAQFRAATGLRPHHYLLHSRIKRAQHLMQTSSLPLIQIALQVGFQSQAHFTTVFKRIVGHSPLAWRRCYVD
jgi:AraC family transcriptional regulator